jgi:hypothetical protein
MGFIDAHRIALDANNVQANHHEYGAPSAMH